MIFYSKAQQQYKTALCALHRSEFCIVFVPPSAMNIFSLQLTLCDIFMCHLHSQRVDKFHGYVQLSLYALPISSHLILERLSHKTFASFVRRCTQCSLSHYLYIFIYLFFYGIIPTKFLNNFPCLHSKHVCRILSCIYFYVAHTIADVVIVNTYLKCRKGCQQKNKQFDRILLTYLSFCGFNIMFETM